MRSHALLTNPSLSFQIGVVMGLSEEDKEEEGVRREEGGKGRPEMDGEVVSDAVRDNANDLVSPPVQFKFEPFRVLPTWSLSGQDHRGKLDTSNSASKL